MNPGKKTNLPDFDLNPRVQLWAAKKFRGAPRIALSGPALPFKPALPGKYSRYSSLNFKVPFFSVKPICAARH
jgi:hypothetical protein